MPNRRVNRTARVSFFLKVEKLLNDMLSINFFGNPCCPLPKRYLLEPYPSDEDRQILNLTLISIIVSFTHEKHSWKTEAV
ncbi:uncharacterized protein TOL2_C20190 [Desulfobacula toluolica Tol2]|uniref:Uncharacterized protein n=1 Tax=Desulfobacula toluolica (strain DSM 7467 / Tol2) TaxID=651182 RepID=K0NGU3_DESTT|nr:uncharacterized protein TOL2_C20190 [Desulfobacula toluolica Tol2]